MVSLNIGSSDGRARARIALTEAEDRLLQLDEHEKKDLGFHVEKEAERTAVLIRRLRLNEETLSVKTDRNMYATLIIGGLLLVKGIITFQDIGNFLHWLGWI